MKKISQTFIFFIVLIIFFQSCNKKGDYEKEFKKIKFLEYETFNLKNNQFYSKIYKLLIYKDKIIAYDYNKETFFSITDISDNIIINHFGKLGQGPNEVMMMPSTLTIINDSFYFYNSSQNSLFSTNLKEKDKYMPNKIIDFDPNKKIINALPIAYKRYIALGGFEGGRYLLLDENGNSLSSFFKYPEFTNYKNITNLHKALAFQGHLMRRPDGKRFFFAGRESEIIEILEIDKTDNINKIFNFHGRIAEFNFDGDGINFTASTIKNKSKLFFIDANCTQNYIYLLYSNKVIKDNLSNALKSSKILVIDWNGKPINLFQLDIDVNYIAVDENDVILYAYNADEEQLVKFNIRGLLKTHYFSQPVISALILELTI